jgi:hypothetical protein
LLGDLSDAIQIGVVTPDQLDQDGFFGFEVVIQASRQDPGGVGDFLERGAQARGGDQRSRRFEDFAAASAVGLPLSDTGDERAAVLHSGPFYSSTAVHDGQDVTLRPAYAVMPSRLQTPTTSSKIDIGTLKDFVADTSPR